MNAKDTTYVTDLAVECQGEMLLLNSLGAVYRPHTRTVLIADLHLGKDAEFGRAGLPTPYGISVSNFQRLSILLETYEPDRLIVLGDFMHAIPKNEDTWPTELSQWLDRYPRVTVAVVGGNHDHVSGRGKIDLRVQWLSQPYLAPPFAYAHHPIAHESLFVLSGHIHPTFVLATRHDRIRTPVFWFRSHMAVLPAFGTFTGGYNITRDVGDRIFLIGPQDIIEIPS